MSLPIKNSLYKYTQKYPRYIIIHHSIELNLNTGNVIIDKPTFQMNSLMKSFYQLDGMYLPYHYVIEKVGDEYHPIVSAPLMTKMEFLDIDDVYQDGIHVCLLGNYNLETVDLKLYNILSLRVIIPLMKVFRIEENNILKHSDISFLPDNKCPGDNFNLDKLKNSIRSNIKRRSISRSF